MANISNITDVTGEYDFDVRNNEVLGKLRELMADEMVKRLLESFTCSLDELYNNAKSAASAVTPVKPQKLVILETIEGDIRALETRIRELTADGDDNCFLVLNAECDKLFLRLDGIGDLSGDGERDIRSQRKQDYSTIKELSRELNGKAIHNLAALRDQMREKFGRDHSGLFADIDEFIRNRSSNPVMKDIDDYRYKLEEIRYKKSKK